MVAQGLSPEEVAVCEATLVPLQHDRKLTRVSVWGKIHGTKEDYLIAQGFFLDRYDEVEDKTAIANNFNAIEEIPVKFYRLGADRVTWYDIPKVDAALREKYEAFKAQLKKKGLAFSPLVGNEKEATEEEPEAAEEGEEPKETPVKLTDEERLALIIDEINQNTAVVPKGAFILNSRHQVIPNPAFSGISAEGITNLNNFYHLRKPAVNSNGVSVTRFLDSLADDSPKGCWAVTKDELTGSVTLRSLWYPGYVFTAKANSTEFSSFYSGTGQRNNDLPFML